MERLFTNLQSFDSTATKPGSVKPTPPLEALEPAFYAKNPEFITYAGSLEDFHARQYRQILLTEFEAVFKMKYNETVMIEQALRDQFWQRFKSPAKGTNLLDGHAAITARFHNPLAGLVLVKINDQVGHALFWSHDAQPLEAGAILGIYGGEYTCGVRQTDEMYRNEKTTLAKSAERTAYVMSIGDEEHMDSSVHSYFADSRVDAYRVGNLMRFITDLPSQNEMERIAVKGEKKECVAVENLARYPVVYQGYPVFLVFSIRRIHPGEMLGMPYTLGNNGTYWTAAVRQVFDRYGHVIGCFTTGHEIQLNIPDDLKVLPVPRTTESEKEYIDKMLFAVISKPQPGYESERVFQSDILFTLRLHHKRMLESGDTRRTTWLQDIINQLKKVKEFKEFFILVHSKFKLENFAPLKNEEFALLHKEILRHTYAINSGRANAHKYLLNDPVLTVSTINSILMSTHISELQELPTEGRDENLLSKDKLITDLSFTKPAC
jgi:hypothetical protein